MASGSHGRFRSSGNPTFVFVTRDIPMSTENVKKDHRACNLFVCLLSRVALAKPGGEGKIMQSMSHRSGWALVRYLE